MPTSEVESVETMENRHQLDASANLIRRPELRQQLASQIKANSEHNCHPVEVPGFAGM
jgi:hypothetical protein